MKLKIIELITIMQPVIEYLNHNFHVVLIVSQNVVLLALDWIKWCGITRGQFGYELIEKIGEYKFFLQSISRVRIIQIFS
jgi:hypothetical protein